jgi:hypothetical protein
MHLGHFALVRWLVNAELMNYASSVVMVASEAIRAGGFHDSLLYGTRSASWSCRPCFAESVQAMGTAI